MFSNNPTESPTPYYDPRVLLLWLCHSFWWPFFPIAMRQDTQLCPTTATFLLLFFLKAPGILFHWFLYQNLLSSHSLYLTCRNQGFVPGDFISRPCSVTVLSKYLSQTLTFLFLQNNMGDLSCEHFLCFLVWLSLWTSLELTSHFPNVFSKLWPQYSLFIRKL